MAHLVASQRMKLRDMLGKSQEEIAEIDAMYHAFDDDPVDAGQLSQ